MVIVPWAKVCSVSPITDTHTDTQTHTKVTTVGTVSGFLEFFLQPIIKDRPNIVHINKIVCSSINSYCFLDKKHAAAQAQI